MFEGDDGKKTIEVLAPAGSYESLRAAVAAGADAVYAGGRSFGARAFARNFTEKELLEAIDYTHLHGCRFYLTVNTLFKEDEICELPKYLKPLYERGLDAVIVQDVGALRVVREYFPEMDIHASTQMTITGAYGARFLKQAGVSRVVPARELSLAEIRHLKERTGMEVECFVHGALCYCYSGQCLMSSMIGGRSGNRGQCAQPCRLFYSAGDGVNPAEKKNGYLLSMKDICTLELIPELVEAGIDSFKIEGRMKRAQYVAGVTAAYRKYTDLYLRHGKKGFHVDEADKERLLDLYNRGGFHGGYYMQKNGKEMISVNFPGHAGVAAVKVLAQKGRELTGLALTDLFAGDVLEFSSGQGSVPGRDSWKYTLPAPRRQTRSALPDSASPEGNTFEPAAKKGSRISLLAPKNRKLAEGCVLYRTRNKQLLDEIDERYVFGKKQEKVYGILKLSAGKPATLEVTCRGVRVKAHTSLNVEEAVGRPLEEARIRRQIYKTNDTEFVFDSLDVSLEGSLFLPMRQFNELRRHTLEALTDQIHAKYHRRSHGTPRHVFAPETVSCFEASAHEENARHICRLSVLVETTEQLNVVLKNPLVERIYLDFDLLGDGQGVMRKLRGETAARTNFKNQKTNGGFVEFYVALPFIMREQTVRRMEKVYEVLLDEVIDGVLLRNYESVQFFKERGFPKQVVLDYPLYVMNEQSVEFWKEQGKPAFTFPLELNHRELAALHAAYGELVVYGHCPVMISAQCIQKMMTGCTHEGRRLILTDRYKSQFPVKPRCLDCYNVIYNTKPLYLYDLTKELEKIAPKWIRFQFTVEDAGRTAKILGQYERIRGGTINGTHANGRPAAGEGAPSAGNTKSMECPGPDEYTRGHFYRGVT